MKVLMIGAGRGVKGGVSTVVNQYYEAHLDEKVDLKYIATMQDGSKVKKALVAVKAWIEFKRCINEYDIVHVHMSARASFYRKSHFIKIAKRCGKKIIIHMHGSEFDVFYDNECDDRQKEQVREIFALADAVIALSEEWKEYLGKICDDKKIIVLYNAVKMPGFVRSDYTDRKVLFLGRLGERKGTYDLISAIPSIVKSVPNIHFYFGGDGETEKCEALCEEMGVQSYTSFLGWVKGEEKEKMLEQCSAFVLPSYHEGMPMSVLEAMSYGCVVVSTYVGGIPKVIRDNDTGYLVEAGNQEALAESLIKAVSGDDKEKIGREAWKVINKEFNIDNNVKKLVKLYDMLKNQVSY